MSKLILPIEQLYIGLDILNPIQWTATDMDVHALKNDLGKDLISRGEGVDTQTTLNNGKPQEVSEEVKYLLVILAPGGSFVFTPVHNIWDDVSPEKFWSIWNTLQENGDSILL